MKNKIVDVINKYVDKEYCKGCLFLRDNDQYNRYRNDISSNRYDYGKGYECLLFLTQSTFSLGYGSAKELSDKGACLKRSDRCRNTPLRTTEVLEVFIKDMDLAIIFYEMATTLEKEKQDKYLEDMVKLIKEVVEK